MSNFTHFAEHVGARPDKVYKSTLFESGRLLLGLNCLEPGQAQAPHTHDGQDKFYFVIEGEGDFLVGDEAQHAGPGSVVCAPAGVEHGVKNTAGTRLVLLVGIAPWR
ncbi:MAG: cupin domain-containing protein [Anaerolineales bacterium]|nr:cupin domain-containing protein [Anaerolineales bacterium]